MDNIYRIDRRRYPRLNTAVDVVYMIDTQHHKDEEAVSKNISAGGICLILYEYAAVDTMLSLEINLPGEAGTIKAVGKVRWVKKFMFDSDERPRYDAGIEFAKIDETDQKKIAQYIFNMR